ncbi:class D sortase [Paenibacillus nasutitermitis]|uniref:Sortase A n=1 Tax=Paenibacillus nasutitermitis TaxID=1652958 RepID=A0A917DSI3_9BACL|nr:class D sortase [Paenibacillus nasutitermitis]GGD64561.1 hypothetical protein GCM10010911_22940 [Paenibacillus nasutitermitis]
MMKKMLSYLLIIAGLALIAMPYVKEWYYDQEQRRLLENIDHDRFADAAGKSDLLLAESYKRLSNLLSQEAETNDPGPESLSATQFAEDPKAIAVIRIDSIDVKLPVLEGATTRNMKYAAVHMTETVALGEIGNSAIAAHRAHTKGRLFNRLGELKVGDTITVEQKDRVLEYAVYKISVVLPTDMSVLNSNETDSILTLITCDPITNPTHRLIVQAKM